MAGQPESLWDEALPVEVKELPEDLAALDLLVGRPGVVGADRGALAAGGAETGRAVLTDGRPTIAMETYVRLMVLKQRYRWGYRTLVAEVSDSIHLRRFCRIALSERVPDESTVRKLTRRIGAETVAELTRALIVKATREKRFRPRAVRIDSTVIEADVKYPTDAGLASQGVRALAREGRKLAKLVGEKKRRVRDRSRAMGRKLRAITRTIRRRSGRRRPRCCADRQTGELLERSIAESRRLAAVVAQAGARAGREGEAEGGGQARGDGGPLREGRPADQAARRGRADPATGSCRCSDPDARPIRKGKLGKPNEFGLRHPAGGGDRAHPARRARADPAGLEQARQPGRGHAAARHGRRARAARDSPREVALDGGFNAGPTSEALSGLAPERCSSPAANNPAPNAPSAAAALPNRREGRISHLKRRYGLDRSPPERRRGPADLDWMGDPRLQRSTRSPSEPGETLPTAPDKSKPITTTGRPCSPSRARPFRISRVFPRQVTTATVAPLVWV